MVLLPAPPRVATVGGPTYAPKVMVRGNPIKLALALAAFAAAAGPLRAAQPTTPAADESHSRWGVIEKFCYECHNTTDWAG